MANKIIAHTHFLENSFSKNLILYLNIAFPHATIHQERGGKSRREFGNFWEEFQPSCLVSAVGKPERPFSYGGKQAASASAAILHKLFLMENNASTVNMYGPTLLFTMSSLFCLLSPMPLNKTTLRSA